MTDRWSEWRYERLLPLAARGRCAARGYALAVATVEFWRDARRRELAVARLARGLDVSRAAAARLFHASLASEAQEESDSARFMADPEAFARWLPARSSVPQVDGPVVFATLHLGSPVLGFLFLRGALELDLKVIVRGLDERNPMDTAKRRWGERKMRWLEQRAPGAILRTDASAVAAAREHLLDGQAVFAAVDVPGDVASRTAEVELCGERLRFSAGVTQLATITGSTLVPVVALGGGRRMRVHFGTPVPTRRSPDPFEATFRELEKLIRRFPGEWWLWPLVHPVHPVVPAAPVAAASPDRLAV